MRSAAEIDVRCLLRTPWLLRGGAFRLVVPSPRVVRIELRRFWRGRGLSRAARVPTGEMGFRPVLRLSEPALFDDAPANVGHRIRENRGNEIRGARHDPALTLCCVLLSQGYRFPQTVGAECTLKMQFVTDLDTRLLRLSETDYFTLRDALQGGVACFGTTGSGKTSGSGKALASAYLRAGMGGVVLCAKPDEIDLWRRYAKENGRSRDIVLFGDGGDRSFNFLDYEVKAQGLRGIGSVTECVMRILEAERIVTPGSSAGTDPFWERSPRQLLNNTLPVLYCAYGTVRMEDIYNFITSAPKSVDDLEDAGWQARSFMFKTIVAATDAPQAPIDPAEGQKILRFWQDEFAPLDAKTRGNVVINLSSALDRFLRGRLRDHFCRATNLTPEDTFKDGRIILMAMPSLSWNEDGLIGQHVFKYMWQRAVLRRNAMAKAFRTRPVFLWADEAQYFVGTKDAEFQATCRSSLACTVYLSQSLPSYLASLGGQSAKALADQLLGNFGTKVFHSNSDPETNDWASRTIGRKLTVRNNFTTATSKSRSKGLNESSGWNWGKTFGSSSSSSSRDSTHGSSSGSTSGESDGKGRNASYGTSESRSTGGSEVMDFEVEPRTFAHELRNGVSAVYIPSAKFVAMACNVLPGRTAIC